MNEKRKSKPDEQKGAQKENKKKGGEKPPCTESREAGERGRCTRVCGGRKKGMASFWGGGGQERGLGGGGAVGLRKKKEGGGPLLTVGEGVWLEMKSNLAAVKLGIWGADRGKEKGEGRLRRKKRMSQKKFWGVDKRGGRTTWWLGLRDGAGPVN